METELAELLKLARQAKGESLRSAAEQLSVDASYLSRVENGSRKPSDDFRSRASHYYGLDADETELAAGGLPADVVEIIRSRPELIERLRSEFGQ